MQNRLKRGLQLSAIIAFWLLVWKVISVLSGQILLVPPPEAVAVRWVELACTSDFWVAAGFTVLRVIAGFSAGVLAGAVLGWLTYRIKFLNALFSPLLKIVRATPVASFIILVFVLIKSSFIPVFISFLTVLPIIWQTVFDGLSNVSKDLKEMSDVYGFTRLQKAVHIYAMSIFPEFITGCVNGLGFAWKSGIAAEVIVATDRSLGKYLYKAKIGFETVDIFACTLTVIVLSVLFEYLLKKVLLSRRNGGANK